MYRKAIAIAALAAAAVPAQALAQGRYYVRNDTGTNLNCGLRRERGAIVDRFLLRAGGEWSQETRGTGPRTLVCDGSDIPPRFRLNSGIRYALLPGLRSGSLILREADAEPR